MKKKYIKNKENKRKKDLMPTITLSWHCLFYCIFLYRLKLLHPQKTVTMKLQTFNQTFKQFHRRSVEEYVTPLTPYSVLVFP